MRARVLSKKKTRLTFKSGVLTDMENRRSKDFGVTSSEPLVRSSWQERVDPEKIAVRAYELWEQRGRPIGSEQEDWLEAERELTSHSERDKRLAA